MLNKQRAVGITKIMAGKLNGYRILILETREEAQFARLLTEQGAEVMQCPMFIIQDAPDTAPIEAWIGRFIAMPCDDLVLTTGEGLRRLLVPVGGSLGMGYLLYRYFPDARGSGVPQTKAALYAREGNISFGTVIGKFFCTSATLASGIPLGREGPAAQVGAGIASVLGRWLGLRTEKVKRCCPWAQQRRLRPRSTHRSRPCCFRWKR